MADSALHQSCGSLWVTEYKILEFDAVLQSRYRIGKFRPPGNRPCVLFEFVFLFCEVLLLPLSDLPLKILLMSSLFVGILFIGKFTGQG